MQSFLIADSSAGANSLSFRGERDYIHSSDFLEFVGSILDPEAGNLRVRIDFMQPIRSQVRLIFAEKFYPECRDDPPAMLSIASDYGTRRYAVAAERSGPSPKRKDEVCGVARDTYQPDGFRADVSSDGLQRFLFDVLSGMKTHWQTFHQSKDEVPLVRRVDIDLPFQPTDHVEGYCHPLKFGAQRWYFKDRKGNQLPLKIDILLLRHPPQ